MSETVAPPSEEKLPADQLRSFGTRVLRAVGMPDEDAAITADAMVWADLRGLPAHGIAFKLPQVVRRIKAGGTSAEGRLELVRETPGISVYDAHDAWGQVAAAKGMKLAVAKARDAGAGLVLVRNITSAAALGYFPWLAIRERMIGIAICNGPALQAPLGGTKKVLGNLAHAIGVPALSSAPIIFDSATTVVSTGQLDVMHERGQPAPAGAVLNEKGEPTLNPMDWLKGSLLPAGGHRGYGLALMFEILTGVLAGGQKLAPHVGGPSAYGEPQGVSLFLLAIDPAGIMPFEKFGARVDQVVQEIRSSPPSGGHERVYLPGERSSILMAWQSLEDVGIPLLAAKVVELKELGAELDVAW